MVNGLFSFTLEKKIEIVVGHCDPLVLHLINIRLDPFKFVLGILSLPDLHGESIGHLLVAIVTLILILILNIFLELGMILLAYFVRTLILCNHIGHVCFWRVVFLRNDDHRILRDLE